MHIRTSAQPALALGFGEYTLNWGTHLCALYESDAERDEIVMGFLRQGNADGDLQAYCPAGSTTQEFAAKMARRHPECAEDLKDANRFQLFSPRDLYYPNGEFSPRAMDAGLAAFFAATQAGGPRNLRVVGEMVWSRSEIPGVEHLMVYESRLNYFIPGKPLAAICLYNLNHFPGSAVMNILRTHPYTICGGVITENPYYQEPAVWLARNAPDFVSIS